MANVAFLVNAVTGAPEYSGRMVRQAMSVALGGATAARPLGARSGVRPGTPASTVALPTATSYVIHPHAGVLDTQASAFAGPYWYVVGSDGADETGTVDAAHATWPRKDILWVRVDDPSEAGTDPPAIVTGYTAGVAAVSNPAVPATPARAMRLATISVPLAGGGAPTIVFDAPNLSAPGVVVGISRASSVGIGTSYTVMSTAPTITVDGVQRVKITAGAYAIDAGGAGTATIRLVDNGTIIQSRNIILINGYSEGVDIFRSLVPTAGAHVYALEAVSAAGTPVMFGSATSPIEVLVEILPG